MKYTEETSKGKMWRVKFKDMSDLDILAEEGYLPSDKLDEDAEEIIEDYDV